jgi:hypothetical protein
MVFEPRPLALGHAKYFIQDQSVDHVDRRLAHKMSSFLATFAEAYSNATNTSTR